MLYKVVLTFVCENVLSVTIQTEATFKQKLLSITFLWYCLLMLFKVILTFAPVDEILEYHYSLKSYIEQYFPLVLFVNAVILTFVSVDEILK